MKMKTPLRFCSHVLRNSLENSKTVFLAIIGVFKSSNFKLFFCWTFRARINT